MQQTGDENTQTSKVYQIEAVILILYQILLNQFTKKYVSVRVENLQSDLGS